MLLFVESQFRNSDSVAGPRGIIVLLVKNSPLPPHLV